MKIPSPSVHIISVEIQRLRLVKMEHWTHKQIKYLVKKKDLYKTNRGSTFIALLQLSLSSFTFKIS